MNRTQQPAIGFIFLIVVIAALSRLVPHPQNFAPITGMALAGAAYINRKALAFLLPILALWIGDLVLNNTIYSTYFDGAFLMNMDTILIYIAFALVVALGILMLKKINVKTVFLASISGSVLFFLVSNFAVWASGILYPKTIAGLTACYAAALPFFQNTITGDLFYTALIFGAIELSRRYVPNLVGAKSQLS